MASRVVIPRSGPPPLDSESPPPLRGWGRPFLLSQTPPIHPTLRFEASPSQEDLDPLHEGLTKHAQPFTQRPGFRGVAFFAEETSGELLGGVYGYLNWNWLDVSLLWVREDLRSQGLGRRLLEALEDYARAQGCRKAQVDTFDFQALDFYLHRGYEIFAELDDYPPGHRRCYLKKTL